ncbi:MAG TPA: response regulator [Chitinophagaceae bacterium]|nr:response regulator [Chitinophagaceae bacterium]
MSFKHPRTIFIIDDDQTITSSLRDFLLERGDHQIHCFETGEQALHELHRNPEVIVLAYHLNKHIVDAMNGMQTMDEFRKKQSNIHFIMWSGQESYGVALQTITHGAEHYFLKDEDAFENIATVIENLN